MGDTTPDVRMNEKMCAPVLLQGIRRLVKPPARGVLGYGVGTREIPKGEGMMATTAEGEE